MWRRLLHQYDDEVLEEKEKEMKQKMKSTPGQAPTPKVRLWRMTSLLPIVLLAPVKMCLVEPRLFQMSASAGAVCCSEHTENVSSIASLARAYGFVPRTSLFVCFCTPKQSFSKACAVVRSFSFNSPFCTPLSGDETLLRIWL